MITLDKFLEELEETKDQIEISIDDSVEIQEHGVLSTEEAIILGGIIFREKGQLELINNIIRSYRELNNV